MAKHVTCGRHDCTFNYNSNCSLNSIAIGRDMTCQFYNFDKAHNADHSDVFKPVPMAVFGSCYKKLGTIYPAGWRVGDTVFTEETFVKER